MMISNKEKGLKFLNEMQAEHITKDHIFKSLFDACGTGDNVNTKHVFFQDVIIKFNASKASAVIANHMPYETESHYVDIAIYAYIRSGYPLKNFNDDLDAYKKQYGTFTPHCHNENVVFASA